MPRRGRKGVFPARDAASLSRVFRAGAGKNPSLSPFFPLFSFYTVDRAAPQGCNTLHAPRLSPFDSEIRILLPTIPRLSSLPIRSIELLATLQIQLPRVLGVSPRYVTREHHEEHPASLSIPACSPNQHSFVSLRKTSCRGRDFSSLSGRASLRDFLWALLYPGRNKRSYRGRA